MEVISIHKNKHQLHKQEALIGAALGAVTGYSRKGKEGAATGAAIGSLAALIVGEQAVKAL